MLEDHADLFARLPQFCGGEGGQLLIIHRDRARGGPFEQVDAAHQRGFTGARKADDAEDFPSADRKRNIAHGVYGAAAGGKILDNMCQFYQDYSSLLHKKTGGILLPA